MAYKNPRGRMTPQESDNRFLVPSQSGSVGRVEQANKTAPKVIYGCVHKGYKVK